MNVTRETITLPKVMYRNRTHGYILVTGRLGGICAGSVVGAIITMGTVDEIVRYHDELGNCLDDGSGKRNSRWDLVIGDPAKEYEDE